MLVWKLDNKTHASKREVKEAKFLKNEKVVASSKPGLREGKGAWRERGDGGGEGKGGGRGAEKGRKIQEKEKKASLNSILQKFTIDIRVSKKSEFSPLFWHPVSLQI